MMMMMMMIIIIIIVMVPNCVSPFLAEDGETTPRIFVFLKNGQVQLDSQ